MCHSDPTGNAIPNGHIQTAICSLYSRIKAISLESSLLSEDNFDMVAQRVVTSLPFVNRATAVIEAVDDKLETALAAASYLRGVPTNLVKKCHECKRKVSPEEVRKEVRKLIEAVAVAIGTRICMSSTDKSMITGTKNFHNALKFCRRFSLARMKLSSFEYIEATAHLTKLKTGSSFAVPEAVLDQLFTAMFGVKPAKQLLVHMSDGSTRCMVVRRTQTVQRLKDEIRERAGIPTNEQFLLYNGRELCDQERLSDECKVRNGGMVHVMGRVAGGMRIKVKTSEKAGFMEIDVDPSDTVESMMAKLHQKTGGDCQLELCLPADQCSCLDLITQLGCMINQGAESLLETARSWHTQDCTVSDPNFGEMSGLEACFSHYSTIARALNDVTVSINRIEEPSQNTVKVCWTLAAVLSGPLLGIQPTGERFKVSGVSLHKIVEGAIHSSEFSWDAFGFMAQVGRPQYLSQPLDIPGGKHDSDSEYNGSSGGSGNQSPFNRGSPAHHHFSPESFMDHAQPPVELDGFSLADLLDGSELANFSVVKEEVVQAEHLPFDPHNQLSIVPVKEPVVKAAPVHGDVVCLQYLEYECGYCNVRKVSTSTGGDGRVRIRCECGGKHSDGKPRMHAKWKLCRELNNKKDLLQLEPGQSLNDTFNDAAQPWKRAKTSPF